MECGPRKKTLDCGGSSDLVRFGLGHCNHPTANRAQRSALPLRQITTDGEHTGNLAHPLTVLVLPAHHISQKKTRMKMHSVQMQIGADVLRRNPNRHPDP